MERVLPKTLDYTDVLPLAVESRARRRTFFPINGQSFQSEGANIIRIDLSADALLDTQHSYLRFTFTNKAAAGTCAWGTAGGHSFIRRLRVEQSGTVLEDINSYNRLMGAIVLPCQSTNEHRSERSITEGIPTFGQKTGDGNNYGAEYETSGNFAGVSADPAVGGTATQQASMVLGAINQKDDFISPTDTYDFCIPLNSGLLNNAKLLPLMLMSAPLTIEIELAQGQSALCWSSSVLTDANYEISNVRYIANLIEVGGDVSQQLRMVQEVSGGVLTLAGQTYRHFTGNITATGGDQILNVPARVKSMKSMFFASQGSAPAMNKFDIEFGGNMTLNEYQLKIGSVVYPPTPVRCNFGSGEDDNVWNKRAETLMELAKSWGSVGSTKGMGQLTTMNYLVEPDGVGKLGSQSNVIYGPLGLDLEAFQRVALESGVNTADRSLPISLILNTNGTGTTAQNIDVYVLADALFYLNADGSMSVSV